MVSIKNNSPHEFSETDEKPSGTELQSFLNNYNSRLKGYQFIKTEEPLIETNEEPAGRDPLLIEETFEPLSDLVPNVWKTVRRTYSRKPKSKTKIQEQPQLPESINKTQICPEVPLEDLIVQAMETIANPRGNTLQGIKKFFCATYGPVFESQQVNEAMETNVKRGVARPVKCTKKRSSHCRYRLCNFILHEVKSKKQNTEDLESSVQSESCNTQKANVHENSNVVSKFGDNSMESIVDSKLSIIEQDDVEMKFDTSLLNGQLAIDSDLAPIAAKRYEPVRKDEIDFMVLHSMCFAPHSQGICLYEIAQFLENYYDIDTQSSLPYIERYLKYGIKNGILLKNGDRYMRTTAVWKLHSKLCSTNQVKDGKLGDESGNNQSENIFLCANVKIESIEMNDLPNSKLVLDGEKCQIDPNNTIQSSGEKQGAACVKKRKYNAKKKNSSLNKSIQITEDAKIKPPLNIFEQRLTQLEDSDMELAECIKVEEPLIKLEEGETIEDPFATAIRRKVLPFSFEGIRVRQRQSVRVTTISKAQEGGDKALQNQAKNSKRKFDFLGDFDEPHYTLAELTEYVSRYPKIILDPSVALMWDLSWEEFTLTNDVPCLKLTGIDILNDDSVSCTACDSEIKFGAVDCDVCSCEQEDILEKCNICDLLCNRRDVFRKHFYWEHRALIQGFDDFSVSVSEDNIEKLMNKLDDNNLFHCRICKYSTKYVEVFESHILGKHVSKMNVFPPLPEEEDWEEAVIFRNEITNICCLKCDECGFISNRKDFILYHVLDIHEFESKNNKTLDNQVSNTKIKRPKADGPKKKIKWYYGLCHVCGKLYNNLVSHLKRYQPISLATESETNTNVSPGNEELFDAIESLPLAQRVYKKYKWPRRKRIRCTNRFYLCHVCGKILKRRLGEHLRIHNPRMWRCDVCARQFNRQSNLLTHQRVHTREKPFQCDICKMTFGYKCSIKGHIINVHSETVR